MSRPSKYTDKIGDEICKILATTSKGLTNICEDDKMPNVSTVHRWLNKEKVFCDTYVRAREAQADFLADEVIEIADDSTGDIIVTEKGNVIMDGEFAARSKIKIEARKWKASKLAPKKYGDKIQQSVTIDDKTINQEDREKRIKALEDKIKDSGK